MSGLAPFGQSKHRETNLSGHPLSSSAVDRSGHERASALVDGAVSTRGAVLQLLDTRSVGGIERHVATLAKDLSDRSIPNEIGLYQDHGHNPWLRQLRALGLSYRHNDGTLVGLRRMLEYVRPALVHTHGYKAGILGRLAALSYGIPTVSTFHSGERPGFPLSAYYAMDRWTSLSARRISVSRDIQSRLPFTSRLIPNFIPVSELPPLQPFVGRIGFVGRLSHEKGPDLFCKIAQAMPAEFEWHVYGDGPMRKELEGTEATAGRDFHFHGVVEDMSTVWPKLGALLMPSRFEGLPLAALEAMAHGVPVIASRVGGVSGLIEDGVNGFSFEPSDLSAAERCIVRWASLDDSHRTSLRHTAHELVARKYSPAAQVPVILDVYRQCGLVLPPDRRAIA